MQSGFWIVKGQRPLSERVLNDDEFEFNTMFNGLTRNICLYSGCNTQEQQEQQSMLPKRQSQHYIVHGNEVHRLSM